MLGFGGDSEAKLRGVAIILVLAFWSINMAMDIFFVQQYEPSPFVHGAMMLVLGRLFGIRVGGKGE